MANNGEHQRRRERRVSLRECGQLSEAGMIGPERTCSLGPPGPIMNCREGPMSREEIDGWWMDERPSLDGARDGWAGWLTGGTDQPGGLDG